MAVMAVMAVMEVMMTMIAMEIMVMTMMMVMKMMMVVVDSPRLHGEAVGSAHQAALQAGPVGAHTRGVAAFGHGHSEGALRQRHLLERHLHLVHACKGGRCLRGVGVTWGGVGEPMGGVWGAKGGYRGPMGGVWGSNGGRCVRGGSG